MSEAREGFRNTCFERSAWTSGFAEVTAYRSATRRRSRADW